MNTAAGVLLILVIFAIGVAVLAILFFGKEKQGKFSRFRDKSKAHGRGEKLLALLIGLLGVGVLVLSMTGAVWVHPTMEIAGALMWIGFRAILPGKHPDDLSGRGFLIRAWIELAVALACFGGMIALILSIGPGDRYSWALLFLPLLGLFWFGCVCGGAALHDYLRYVEKKPLPNVEPPPAVLAELLKPPGPADLAPPPPVAAPPLAVQAAAPAPSPLPGLLAGVVCLSAGMWFRATELVSTEVGYIVGVPLFVYGVIRSGLSLLALAKSARRI
jgi:hypothetical protein